MEPILHRLATKVGECLKQRGWFLTTAESCTGGQLAAAITAIAGSSHWFERGFITYSNTAKQDMLGVSPEILKVDGAVSSATVLAMAKGALQRSQAQVSIATSGIAGPEGGSSEKPIGTVWVAWAGDHIPIQTECFHFIGSRLHIQQATVLAGLEKLLKILQKTP